MKFCQLKEQEFREFLNSHPQKTFLQTPEIAQIREKSGWKKYYVGVKENDTIICATMMLSAGNFFRKKVFYAPRGVLIDYENETLLIFFFKELKKFIKKNQGYVFKMDPYLELIERDIDGNIVENGFNHTNIVTRLQNIGFFKTTSEQTSLMFVLDINEKSLEELKKDFRPSTKNVLNKVLKSNIKVRELEYDELPVFKNLTEETSERKNFGDKPLSYYQEMYQLFKPLNLIQYLIAELPIDEYIRTLEDTKKSIIDKLNLPLEERANEKKIKEYEISLAATEKKLKEIKEIQKEVGNNLILSGGMFILYGDEIIYLYSGNYKKYMNFNAQYLIQWEMIQYAVNHNYKRYNFYGITEFQDKHHKDYGMYDFKKGFNGRVIELIGGFELPITVHYKLHHILSFLRNKGRKK